ncbi:unnamed protein product [Parajaminaea phylloscopi]
MKPSTSSTPAQPVPPSNRSSQRSPSPDTSSTTTCLRYISAQEAAEIDQHLMSPQGSGYLLPQLMELAGLACAQALYRSYPPDVFPELLVAAGPGNQGGDGLVAARHAKLWDYNVKVWYPKQGKGELFHSLRQQLEAMEVPFIEEDDFSEELHNADVVLDSIFGFSFQGPPRPPFASALEAMRSESAFEFVGRVTRPPIVSVDIPSGWHVDDGNPDESNYFTPEVVVSLTAPKKGLKKFRGTHFLGGRFLPPNVVEKYSLYGANAYHRDDQVVDVTGWADADDLIEDEQAPVGAETTAATAVVPTATST